MNELNPIELRRIEFEKKQNLPDEDEFICEKTNQVTSLETCNSSSDGLNTIHELPKTSGCKYRDKCEIYRLNKEKR